MDNEVLVEVKGVSKKFCKDLKRSLIYGMKDLTNDFLGVQQNKSQLRRNEFWAIKDISFELRRGESFGLIGHNGAGKSTLLKVLNGLIRPDEGEVRIRGRVGALIELGAGFNPILTGKENIYVNGQVLGFSKKEIDEKYDSIVDFAEIEKFIDTPVQNYSSGMKVRLGFAVAAQMEPDVLLLDEVLAVGDASFMMKCYKLIDSLLEKTAVIFVSHNLPNVVRICRKALVMKNGREIFLGKVDEAARIYENLHFDKMDKDSSLQISSFCQVIDPIEYFELSKMPQSLSYKQSVSLSIRIKSKKSLKNVTLSIDIRNLSDAFVASTKNSSEDFQIKIDAGEILWNIELSSIPVKRGKYFLNVGLISEKGKILALSRNQYRFNIEDGYPALPSDCHLNLVKWEIEEPKQEKKSLQVD